MSFELLNSILLSIYSIAAVSSQSLLDISMALIFMTVFYIFFKNKKIFIFKKIGIEWAFLGYVFVVILGFLINSSKDAEILNSIYKFLWLINIYILIYAFQSCHFETKKIIKSLSVLTLIPTLYSLCSYIYGTDLITGRDNSRITGLVNSSTYHAHGNAMIFTFLVGCLYFSYKKLNFIWRLFSLTVTVLLGLSVVLTFTRGIWFSIFLSSFLVLYFLDWRKLLKFLITSFVCFSLFYKLWPKFNERINDTTRSQSNEERLSLFKVNVQIWKEYPLLGIGYGENLRRNREYWDRPEWNKPQGYITSHAHNQYLNVLATTGVFGFIFFCAFFFFFLIKNFRLIKKTSLQKTPERYAILMVCFWAQVQFVLACFSDVSFEYAKIRALIILVWALVIALEQKPEIMIEEKLA